MKWILCIDKYKEKHKNLDIVLSKVINILKNLNIEEYILRGDFPATTLFWTDKIYFKKYVIECDFPPIKIEIKKISSGNIDKIEFLSAIRRIYARTIL
jgi:hypothetical protein